MAFLYENNPTEPGAHALVIGVGHYPHCGSSADDPKMRGLSDLGGPPHSAIAFAQCLKNRLNGRPLTLRSMEVLWSEPQEMQDWQGLTPPADWSASEAPTRANISQAFERWWNRGDLHEENTMIFFFSGHGVQRTDWILLAEDFGKGLNPFQGAIDIGDTRRAAYRCNARTQLWLIDACRETPRPFRDFVGLRADPLAAARLTDTAGLDSTYLASTTDFRLAAGERNAPSRFTKALLAALRGQAATRSQGAWQIGTGDLQRAINTELQRQSEERNWPEQQCEWLGGSGNRLLLEIDPPKVPMLITCDPEENLSRVDLSIRDADNENVLADRDAADEPWRTEVAAGFRWITAEPIDADLTPNRKPSFVTPPYVEETLEW